MNIPSLKKLGFVQMEGPGFPSLEEDVAAIEVIHSVQAGRAGRDRLEHLVGVLDRAGWFRLGWKPPAPSRNEVAKLMVDCDHMRDPVAPLWLDVGKDGEYTYFCGTCKKLETIL